MMYSMISKKARKTMSDNVKEDKARAMLKVIRGDEVKNERTGHYDDKTMAQRISKYLLEQAKKELEEENNEV